MADAPAIVPVFITTASLATGEIEEAFAEIRGDACYVRAGSEIRGISGEGTHWHRQRWAAENWCRQEQVRWLAAMREHVRRVEGYRFGRKGL